jgi:hypothetical protein
MTCDTTFLALWHGCCWTSVDGAGLKLLLLYVAVMIEVRNIASHETAKSYASIRSKKLKISLNNKLSPEIGRMPQRVLNLVPFYQYPNDNLRKIHLEADSTVELHQVIYRGCPDEGRDKTQIIPKMREKRKIQTNVEKIMRLRRQPAAD